MNPSSEGECRSCGMVPVACVWANDTGPDGYGCLLNYGRQREKLATLERENAALRDAIDRRAPALREMATLLGVEIGGGPRDTGVSSYDLPERLLVAVKQSESRAKALEEERDRLRALVEEVAVRLQDGPPLDADSFDWFGWLTRYEQFA